MIRPQTCPICHKELTVDASQSKHFPFCSERCRQVDFFRWYDGRYAIVEPLTPDRIEAESLPRQDADADGE